jgi:hypothetical protein
MEQRGLLGVCIAFTYVHISHGGFLCVNKVCSIFLHIGCTSVFTILWRRMYNLFVFQYTIWRSNIISTIPFSYLLLCVMVIKFLCILYCVLYRVPHLLAISGCSPSRVLFALTIPYTFCSYKYSSSYAGVNLNLGAEICVSFHVKCLLLLFEFNKIGMGQ